MNRRHFLYAGLTGILLAAKTLRSQPSSSKQSLALKGATVLTGDQLVPLQDATLIVDQGQIRQVAPTAQVAVPANAEVIDLRGKWILPGLIDAHIHFFQSGGLFTRPDIIDLRAIRPYEQEIAAIKNHLPGTWLRYLASGVTSVMDVGGPFWTFQVRERAQHTLLAPRVEVAGPLIGTYAPAELQIADPPIVQASTPRQAQAYARQILAHHPDYLKLWFIHFPGQNLASQSRVMQAAIEEAHARGVRVVVHATQLAVARAAVLAGADVLAHSVDDQPVDDAFIRLLKDRHVTYVTTLMTYNRYHAVFTGQIALSDFEHRIGDPEVIATWREINRVAPAIRAAAAHSMPPTTPEAFRNLKRVTEAGITVAAGTDAGNIGTLHGPSLHHEMELMQQAGLSPQQVLIDATVNGATAMGMAHELGSIAPGKLADLLIVDADPLLDARNARRIYRVVKSGMILDPQHLLINNAALADSARGA